MHERFEPKIGLELRRQMNNKSDLALSTNSRLNRFQILGNSS